MRADNLTTSLYAAGGVQRFHATPLPVPQSVAAHSWGVAVILLAIHPDPSLQLVRAALLHDAAEHKVGDVPATAKEDDPRLREALQRAELRILEELGSDQALGHEEHQWLSLCDSIECCMWSLWVYRETGSWRAAKIARRALEHALEKSEKMTLSDEASQLIEELCAEVNECEPRNWRLDFHG